ncbi:methyltransferase domain protein [Burkholderia pseudomallei]|nr:methyltransferase domain protein [Burkholderia pseudomallei]
MDSTDLVKSISITNLANQRVAVVERVRAALDLLGEAQQLSRAAHLGFPRLVLDESYGCRGRPSITGDYAKRDEAEAAIVRIIDIRGWDYLLSESGLRTFMDAKARDQWNNQIAEGDVPELTAANIEATFAQLYGSRGDMFERGVLECFRRLSWNYRTNEPFKFGKRIIVRYLLSSGSPNHRVTNELDDLIRAFCVLDGKPEPDHRHGAHCLVSDARQARCMEAGNDYFHLRWFKNGNGHLTFLRPDLVDRMNRILAKHYPNALASEAR